MGTGRFAANLRNKRYGSEVATRSVSKVNQVILRLKWTNV
jgi:hypothetical protein